MYNVQCVHCYCSNAWWGYDQTASIFIWHIKTNAASHNNGNYFLAIKDKMQIKLSSQHGNLHNFYVNEKYVHNREFLKGKEEGRPEYLI